MPGMSDKISTRNKTQKKKCISFLTRQFGPREIDNLASNRKSCIKILEINKSIKNSGVLPLSFLQLEDSQEHQHQHYIRCTMTVKHGSEMNSSNSFQQKHDFRTRLVFCVFGWLAWVFFYYCFCLFVWYSKKTVSHLQLAPIQHGGVSWPDQCSSADSE